MLNIDKLLSLDSFYSSLMVNLPINIKESKIHSNPSIINLRSKLVKVEKELGNPLLISYVNSILSLSLEEIASK